MYTADGTRMRVFLDANVLFSVSDLQSRTAQVLARLTLRNHVAITNSYAWDEAWRNISTKRPHLTGLESFRERITIINAFVEPMDVVCVEKDIPILAGAIGARCTHLWTGDKAHLGRYYGQKVQGVMVISGSQLHDVLMAEFLNS